MNSTNVNLEIHLTAAAQKHIVAWIAKHQGTLGLRLGVKKNGCSGLSYVTELVSQMPEQTYRLDAGKGITLFVDQQSLPFINGLTLDYVRDGLNSHFQFINPNEKGSCGCGESFTV